MSANIESYAQLENTDKPWWADKLENVKQFPVNSPWDVVAKTAGLDWEVGLQPIYSNLGAPIPGFKAVTRSSDHRIFAVTKERYTPLQNMKAFEALNEVVNGRMQFHTAGSLDGGRIIWALAKLAGQIRVIGQDVVDKFLLLTTSHDGTKATSMLLTPIRVVCQNTLRMAELNADYLISAKHTENAERKLKSAKDLFLDIERQEKKLEEQFKYLAVKTVSDEQVEAFLYDVLGYKNVGIDDIPTRTKNTAEKIKELYESGQGSELVGVRGSAWGAYNAVTEYVDHYATVRDEEDNAFNRVQSMWYGRGNAVKNRAFNAALAL